MNLKRCNLEATDSGVRICFGNHEKHEDCKWEHFTKQPALEYKWQPIETAPKDGTEIIISGYILNNPAKGRFTAAALFYDGEWRAEEYDLNTFFPPTHWMPFPDPPE